MSDKIPFKTAIVILLTLLLAGLVTFAIAEMASAAPGDPHQEETDGCDHGHTGKPCRPHQDHGKSCVKHGKHGGINEDHCSTTTITEAPNAESPGTTSTTVAPTVRPPDNPPQSPSSATPQVPEAGASVAAVDSAEVTQSLSGVIAAPAELAHTGWGNKLFALGLMLLAFGLTAWFIAKFIAAGSRSDEEFKRIIADIDRRLDGHDDPSL